MSLQVRAAQERKMILTNFPYFCEKYVKIIDKDGNKVPLKLRPYQIRLWNLILKMIAENKPVRIIVLKSRQLGFSTMMQAYLLWRTILNPYSGCLTVAHDIESSQKLFSKVEFAYENLPEFLYKDLEKAKNTAVKGKKLVFGAPLDSSFFVDTAGNKNVGRSMTFQRAHLSEVAFWENIEIKMYGLLQALGKRPGTECVIESTANGMGTYHHNLWLRAADPDSMWEQFFVGWSEDDDCYLPPPSDFKLTNEERELKRKYNLSNGNIYWRRVTINDECGGDTELFRQEYPIEPDEAFIVSGNPYFGPKVVEKCMNQIQPPKKWGRIELVDGKPRMIGSHDPLTQVSAGFIDDGSDPEKSPWWIWNDPKPERSYAIGADVAGGTGKDYSTAHILDMTDNVVVATFRGKLDPDEFAHQLRWMGLRYNVALIAPEKNGEGRATVLKLQKDLFYPRLFFHQQFEDWSGGLKQSWGWTTSSKTRPTMLAQLASGLRENSPLLFCSRTIKEMSSFVRVDTVKIAEAAEGANDDTIMSLAIANSSEVRHLASVFVDLSEFQTEGID